ncbi:hypothetical protein TrVE_jg5293 [Triparma verrucosa]|uniref:Uncharacterized protein n=1 Tax=Triparma verrucosa TaxID=1606542 RepID=A0A9W7FNV9_9STRA|nr:hypothetical protein TrVE_jg5293 [Triparma verrucosa]
MMSVENYDRNGNDIEDQANEDQSNSQVPTYNDAVHVVGAFGLAASLACVISEAHLVRSAQKKKFSESSSGALMVAEGKQKVDECAYVFIILSFLLTTWWQKLQGGLVAVTALCSLYLLSALGVERDLRSNIGNVGAIGFLALMFAVLIGMFSLNDTLEVRQTSGTLSGAGGAEGRGRASRAISAGEMQDGMILGSLL